MAVDVAPDAEQETPHSQAFLAFRAEQKSRNAAYWQAFWEAKLAPQAPRAQPASATIARDVHSGR